MFRKRVSKMNKKKQQVMQKGIQLGEAVFEYGKGNNYKQALELLGSDFNAFGYKKRRSTRGGIWEVVTKEAPRRRFDRVDQYIAVAGKLLKTWRPLIVLIMVIFQEYTCLLSVSHATPTVIILRALLPNTVNPSTAHHRRAQARITVHPQLATDLTIKLCYTYISCVCVFFCYGSSFHIYACVIPK